MGFQKEKQNYIAQIEAYELKMKMKEHKLEDEKILKAKYLLNLDEMQKKEKDQKASIELLEKDMVTKDRYINELELELATFRDKNGNYSDLTTELAIRAQRNDSLELQIDKLKSYEKSFFDLQKINSKLQKENEILFEEKKKHSEQILEACNSIEIFKSQENNFIEEICLLNKKLCD